MKLALRLRTAWTSTTGLRRCNHRSHLLRLPCLRGSTYDHRCARHNASCFHDCPKGS